MKAATALLLALSLAACSNGASQSDSGNLTTSSKSSGGQGSGASAAIESGVGGDSPVAAGGMSATAAGGGTGESQAAGGDSGGVVGVGGSLPEVSTQSGGAPSSVDPASDYEADFVFDQATMRTFSITLPEEAWNTLRLNARDKEYIEADLTVDDEAVGTVGLRFKGGYTLDSCFSRSDESTCAKMSMKLKFSEYETDKRWHGLKRINLNSMKADASYVRDRLAYKLFNDMGMVSPRSTHARVEINGVYHGLFALVEAVDGRFTDARYPGNGDGNLYKEAWPQVTNVVYYDQWLKTNDDVEPFDHTGIVNFASSLLSVGAEAELPAAASPFMNLDALQRYMALDLALAHWDGVTGFYCNRDPEWGLPFDCSNHNFYLYQYEESEFFELIPWDMDATFLADDFMKEAGIPEWNATPGTCEAEYEVFGNIPFQEPACDPLLRAAALAPQAAYKAAIEELLGGPFMIAALEASVAEWSTQIAAAVAEEPEEVDFGTEAWQDAINGRAEDPDAGAFGGGAIIGLLEEIAAMRAILEAELALL